MVSSALWQFDRFKTAPEIPVSGLKCFLHPGVITGGMLGGCVRDVNACLALRLLQICPYPAGHHHQFQSSLLWFLQVTQQNDDMLFPKFVLNAALFAGWVCFYSDTYSLEGSADYRYEKKSHSIILLK